MKTPPLVMLVLASLIAVSSTRADWLQYRGPTQNGLSPERGFNTPKVLWKAQVGKGTSSVVTQGDKAFTMGNDGSADQVYCFDAKSGQVVWKQSFSATVDANMFEGGTRSTPSLGNGRIFVLSHAGDLRCLDAATGKLVWQKNFVSDFGGHRPDWGYSGAPLLAGTLVICDVGGKDASTVAFDQATGKVVWKSGSDVPGYAMPVLATFGGVPTVVVFKSDTVVGLEGRTGKELWRSPWKTEYGVNAATPLLIDGEKLFISSGYNAGCALLQISANGAKELWRNKNLRAHINSPVATGGAIFGVDGNTGGGNLVCLDAATGQRKWEEKSVKGGALVLADGRLIVLTEKGELVVCEASPAGFKSFARSPQLQRRCWAQPTLDGGRLFLRSNEGDLVCLDVKG